MYLVSVSCFITIPGTNVRSAGIILPSAMFFTIKMGKFSIPRTAISVTQTFTILTTKMGKYPATYKGYITIYYIATLGL